MPPLETAELHNEHSSIKQHLIADIMKMLHSWHIPAMSPSAALKQEVARQSLQLPVLTLEQQRQTESLIYSII